MNEVIINVKNITKIYDEMTDNPVVSLKDVSLSVEKGEFIAIMGASGSGKSTFINCISTMDKPTKGEVFIYEKSTLDLTDKEIGHFRSHEIGFIFQDYQLLDYLTIKENIAFPLSMNNVDINEIEKRIQKVSQDLKIEQILEKYPDECSGGQKQRTAIARALVCQPNIIIADEPTGNLDSQNTYELLNILKSLNEDEGKTMILVTHDIMVASYASRLLYIQDGQIKEEVKRGDFKTQEEYFYNIAKLNSKEQLLVLKN